MSIIRSTSFACAALAMLLSAAPSPAAISVPSRTFLPPSRPAASQALRSRVVLRSNRRRATATGCTADYGTAGDYFVGVPSGGNFAGGLYSFVGGGVGNQACGDSTGIGAGGGNVIDVDSTSAFVGGGGSNYVDSDFGFVGAGTFNQVTGTSTFIGAGRSNSASGTDSSIGAGEYNSIIGTGSFIGAGGTSQTHPGGTSSNLVTGTDSFLGAGDLNTVDAMQAFVGSGQSNSIAAAAAYSVIAGGVNNAATAQYADVLGGYGNSATGQYAVIAGGNGNGAAGTLSFAAGYHAGATHNGSFVWSDYGSGSSVLRDTAVNQFVVRASGGTYVYSNEAATTGVHLAAGSGAWSSLSDRNAKTDIAPLNDHAILEKVSALPVSVWSYRAERGVRHVGPMAQDFYSAFGVGEDDRHITSIDEDGIALSAIKALHEENRRLASELEDLKARNTALEKRVFGTTHRIDRN